MAVDLARQERGGGGFTVQWCLLRCIAVEHGPRGVLRNSAPATRLVVGVECGAGKVGQDVVVVTMYGMWGAPECNNHIFQAYIYVAAQFSQGSVAFEA